MAKKKRERTFVFPTDPHHSTTQPYHGSHRPCNTHYHKFPIADPRPPSHISQCPPTFTLQFSSLTLQIPSSHTPNTPIIHPTVPPSPTPQTPSLIPQTPITPCTAPSPDTHYSSQSPSPSTHRVNRGFIESTLAGVTPPADVLSLPL